MALDPRSGADPGERHPDDTGKRKEDKEARDDDYCACERWTGTFFRSVALPPGIDPERVRATFRSGVLEVHFPETKEAKAKEIEIGVE